MKNLEELNAILASANAKRPEYLPPFWSRLYLCLRRPSGWINRLALGRVYCIMGDANMGREYNATREFFRITLDTAWAQTFARCPWAKFKRRRWSAKRRDLKKDPQYFAWRRYKAFEKIRARFRAAHDPRCEVRISQLNRQHDKLSKVRGPKGWLQYYLNNYL